EALGRFVLWHVEVVPAHPAEQAHSLLKHCVALEVVSGDGLAVGELRRERAGVVSEVPATPSHKGYSRFMTSFSMASSALSNSAGDCDFQGSTTRIFSAMNWV
ncbi:hypothetical protein NY486_15915, partial [Enterobacter hormaechei]|nr:hypothetical protein [Enterobacter hormaechei]